MSRRLGQEIHLEIVRANGRVEDYGRMHNVLGSALLTAATILGPSGTLTFGTYSTRIRTLLDGTFQGSGTTVTRVSGTGSLATGSGTGRLIRFADGSEAYTTGTGTATSVPAFSTAPISAQAAAMYELNLTSPTGLVQFVSVTPNATALVGNDLITDFSGTMEFAPSASNYTLRRISMYRTSPNSPAYVDLPVDIPILIGDVIRISYYRLTFGWDTLAARVSGTALITGLGAGCSVLRATPANVTDAQMSNQSRIWLLNSAQALPLTDMSLAIRAPASITSSLVQLTPLGFTGNTNTSEAASHANGYISRQGLWAATSAPYTGVKQVVWGNTTYIAGIYTLDTPVDLPANKVINITSTLRYAQNYDLTP